MGILPDYLLGAHGFGSGGNGGLLGALPPWLFDAQQFPLPPAWSGGAAAATPGAAMPGAGEMPVPGAAPMPAPAELASPVAPSADPSAGAVPGDLLARLRAAVPQGLADNSNSLLAFAGGALRAGIGQGLTDAAKVGLHESELLQRRNALAAQHAATVRALRGLGLPDAPSLAAMNPYLARILLARAYAK